MTLTVLLFMGFICSSPVNAQWIKMNSGTSESLTEIFFLDSNTLFASGGTTDGIIMESINGGLSWSTVFSYTQDVGPGWGTITSLVFTTPLKGIAVSTKKDTIIKSSDGGKTWHVQYSPNTSASYGFPDISFVNESVAYAPGYKSTDGGDSWQLQNAKLNKFPFIPKDVHFFNEGTGLVAGYSDCGEIYKTQDSGATWYKTYVPYDTWEIYEMHFPTSGIGYAVSRYYGFGEAAEVLKTTDGGENWFSIYLDHNQNFFNALFCPDTSTCYLVGNKGLIMYSADGGNTWERQNSGTQEDLFDIRFYDKYTGYVTGRNGTILKTTNGGKSAIREGHYTNVSQIFPNPSSGVFNLIITADPESFIEIYDGLGHLILSEKVRPSMQIDLSAHPKGVYYYRAIGTAISTGKLIKN